MDFRFISCELGYPNLGHKDKAFVDVNTLSDQALFIDPSLILTSKDAWCIAASEAINSYFDDFYAAYRDGDESRQRYLLSNAREINDTRLGFGGGNNGHGNTAEGLLERFFPLTELVKKIDTISSASDLPVVISGFDKDGMSDMITNIIHKPIYDFTVQQMELRGVKPNAESSFFTWNAKRSSWEWIEGVPSYSFGKGNILLVPKTVVHRHYLYRPEHFLRHMVLTRMQNERACLDETGKLLIPRKKTLIQELEKTGDKWMQNTVLEEILKNPKLLKDYQKLRPHFYANRSLSDEDLDFCVYGNVVNI